MSNATLHLSLPQPGCCRPLAAARRLNLVNADGTGSAVAKALRPVSSLNRNAFNAALLSSQKAKSRGCGHSYFVPPPPQRATAVRTIRNRHKANTLMNLKQKRERCKFRMLHCSVKVDAWLAKVRRAKAPGAKVCATSKYKDNNNDSAQQPGRPPTQHPSGRRPLTGCPRTTAGPLRTSKSRRGRDGERDGACFTPARRLPRRWP
ncbi:hypothetical protein DF3PB_210021 [uncultured Defluviicoccus sp.]|uniref:Uncharacterized protein n=1 Tax=metagenome TaxID=256318 RepID=A0A380TDV0_9ZZZZ|nr:hypothetical protein DF3PB_210021 [uncultured Defluviicoccus sp.]